MMVVWNLQLPSPDEEKTYNGISIKLYDTNIHKWRWFHHMFKMKSTSNNNLWQTTFHVQHCQAYKYHIIKHISTRFCFILQVLLFVYVYKKQENYTSTEMRHSIVHRLQETEDSWL